MSKKELCCEKCWDYDSDVCIDKEHCHCHQLIPDKETKCCCGEQTTFGVADVEIGGVCHRANNPCYIISEDTLPEKCCNHPVGIPWSCICICHSEPKDTLPEEKCTCIDGEYKKGGCDCKKHGCIPKHNHSRGQAGCGEYQKEKSYMCSESIN